MTPPRFFYDLASPYAYLAARRIGDLIPDADWQPILLGGLFKLNGRHSWLYDEDVPERMNEIQERAQRYGIPQRFYSSVPTSWLTVMRACTAAKRAGHGREFSLACFRAVHAEGQELWHDDQLAQLAPHAGMEPDELLAATQDPEVKAQLRTATDEAHAIGVPGVPTVVVGEQVFWGDDRLQDAAGAARQPA